MSRYLVQLVHPATEGYLCRGELVAMARATLYAHPSSARLALDVFLAQHEDASDYSASIVDTRDTFRR